MALSDWLLEANEMTGQQEAHKWGLAHCPHNEKIKCECAMMCAVNNISPCEQLMKE